MKSLMTGNVRNNCPLQLSVITDSLPEIFKKIISNNRKACSQVKPSSFDSSKIKVRFEDYIKRLVKYSQIESNTLLYTLILIDTFVKKSGIALSDSNLHKIFLISLIVSIKFLEDEIFTEEHYCLMGGLSKDIFAQLEFEYLSLLDYEISVDKEKFEIYYNTFFAN